MQAKSQINRINDLLPKDNKKTSNILLLDKDHRVITSSNETIKDFTLLNNNTNKGCYYSDGQMVTFAKVSNYIDTIDLSWIGIIVQKS